MNKLLASIKFDIIYNIKTIKETAIQYTINKVNIYYGKLLIFLENYPYRWPTYRFILTYELASKINYQ